MKWEYMSVMFSTAGFFLSGDLNCQAFTDRLNELGAEGWELVSVFDTNNAGSTLEVVAVLKRPLA
jgi:hypothetical protein